MNALGWLSYGRKKDDRMLISVYHGEEGYILYIDKPAQNDKLLAFYEKYQLEI